MLCLSPFRAGMWYNSPAMKNDCRNAGQKGKREALKRRVRVEIDLGALVRNYRKIVAHVKPMKVLAVLKANAYGLGENLHRLYMRDDLPVVPHQCAEIDLDTHAAF